MHRATMAAGVCLLALCAGLSAGAPYDPPPTYYATATATDGPTLKSQLHTIISTNWWTGGLPVQLSYTGQTRFAMAIGSRASASPSDPNQVLIYDGVLHTKVWNSGATWNTEHTWPRSRGVGSSGRDDADCHMLRPSLSASNGERGNSPYGTGSGEFDPNQVAGQHFRGECARAMFYAATRYNGSESATVDLELVSGTPGTNQMGDLAELLRWHYDEEPGERERRRNHVLWSNNPADWYDVHVNPSSITYHQGNRNPFIDHPEFVWPIWGLGPNNATLFVGAAANPDGSSALNLDLGRALLGHTFATSVPLHKSGAHPTTWTIALSGDVESDAGDTPHTYPFDIVPPSIPQPTIPIVVDTAPLGYGPFAGAITIDNTDLTSAGPGKGAQDADDTITVLGEAVDHANPSFDPVGDFNGVVVDFGTVGRFASVAPATVSLWNLPSVHGATAHLDIDAVNASGDTAVLSISLTPAAGLPAAQAVQFAASVDTAAPTGAYEAVFTVTVSDENIPGATPLGSVTVTVTAVVAPACDGDINGDGATSAEDFVILAGNFGQSVTPHTQGDLNGDGQVDAADFVILAGDFGCAG